jgi:dihydrofolate synthase/folylpolyglutamate synthase
MYALGHELAQTPSHKFDLAHMRVLLSALENPERRFPSVLVAGTNGKGSTAATLASILEAAGLRTGLYTSPHLVRINERIRINGEEIADVTFALLHDVVERTAERLIEDGELPWHPSFFEMLTAMAFECFATSRLDIAVIEVGMGGRLDATNVVEPLVSVITDISLDHEKFLGNTIAEIAREKAGIIHKNGVVVTLPQSPEANNAIGNAVLEMDARAVSAVPYVPPVSPASPQWFGSEMNRVGTAALARPVERSPTAAEDHRKDIRGTRLFSRYPVQLMEKQIAVETPLVGRHQLRNVALAIAAAEELSTQGFAITPESIERGIRETQWPGRFQVIAATSNMPEFVLDVAHNPAGAWALRSTLSSLYEGRKIIFVFGAMRDKAISEITEILFPLGERVIATMADNPRSATPQEIQEAAARTGAEIEPVVDVPSAIKHASNLALSDKSVRRTQNMQPHAAAANAVVVVTGSIYVVGEAMRTLRLHRNNFSGPENESERELGVK